MATVPAALDRTESATVGLLEHGETLSRAGLLFAAGLIVLSYLALAYAHVRDRYQVYAVSGVHLGLAAHTNHGVLYPALFDGDKYGGTRYMPLAFLPLAGMARMTGDYVLGGKLLTYALALVLLLQVFVILRRQGIDTLIAGVLACLIPASSSGYLACMTIRGDLLPVVLQLAALLAIERSSTSRQAVLAGLLCAVAVLAKITAVWAIPVVFFTLLSWRKQSGLQFLAALFVSLLLSFAAVQLLSSGRFWNNLTALSLAEPEGLPRRLGRGLAGLGVHTLADPTLTMLLAPAALMGLFAARQDRHWSVYHSALAWCVPLLVVILSERGADYNHLLDLIVLAVVVTGCLLRRLSDPQGALARIRPVAYFFLAWVLLASWGSTYTVPLRGLSEALGTPNGGITNSPFASRPLASLIGPDERILSEDTLPEVCRDQTPTLLDTFMYARMVRAMPQKGRDLLERIRQREFDWILTRRSIETNSGENDFVRNMGVEIILAIRTHYTLRTQADGYFVFVPRCGEDAQARNDSQVNDINQGGSTCRVWPSP